MNRPMVDHDLREKLRGEIAAVEPAALLPHHRRGGLVVLAAHIDLLDVAEAIATDDAETVAALLESGELAKPALGQLADWCAEPALRLQVVIVQPFVLAQLLPTTRSR